MTKKKQHMNKKLVIIYGKNLYRGVSGSRRAHRPSIAPQRKCSDRVILHPNATSLAAKLVTIPIYCHGIIILLYIPDTLYYSYSSKSCSYHGTSCRKAIHKSNQNSSLVSGCNFSYVERRYLQQNSTGYVCMHARAINTNVMYVNGKRPLPDSHSANKSSQKQHPIHV